MRPGRISAAVVLVLVGVVAPPAPALAGGRVLVVDDDLVQCPRAAFTGVQAALDAARIGDTVRVCGGTYAGAVMLDKSVSLVAQVPAAPGVDCLGGGPVPDGSAMIVGAVTMSGPGARLDGLVVTGAPTGVTTSADAAGYQLRRAVVQGNEDFGIDLRSSGGQATVVEGNCIRGNAGDGTLGEHAGIVADSADLIDAAIRNNTFTGNLEAISIVGLRSYSKISIRQNTVRGEAIAIAGSTESEILRNDLDNTGSGRDGIVFGGGNVGLVVGGNTIVGALPGMKFCSLCTNDHNVAPNAGLLITGNMIRNGAGSGITMAGSDSTAPVQLTRSVIERNTITGAPASGIFLNDTAVGNTVVGNTSSGNARGINVAGATGNVLLRNTLTGNTIVDARDTTPDQNTWIGNRCATDDPVGRLCATGRPAGAAAPTAIPPAPAVDRSRWPCLRVPVWDIDPVDGGAWMMVSVVAPDAPAGTFCGA